MSGTVEQVVGSVDEQSAEALVVRTAWRRRKGPVADVGVVVPAARLIVVDDPHNEVGRASTPASSIGTAVNRHGPRVARAVVSIARTLAILVAAGVVTVACAFVGVAVGVARFAAALGTRLRVEASAQREAAERRRRA